MPACPKCAAHNPEGFRFCGSCGALLAGDAGEIRKTVTVLFADVTGSAALGERLDPEALRHVMSRYFDVARTALERHGGTVEKFIGDAVMAVFGVPVAHEDDALRAVRAAVELRDAVAGLQDELERRWGARLEIRTGVNTGDVVSGDPSAGQSFVSGDAVNVAARLEQAAKPGEILIGPQTLRLARDAVRVERLEPLTLKGKAELVDAVRLVEVLGGAAAFARHLDSPMVGRDADLQQLLDAFDRAARAPGCDVVTVLGAAGVGKSRLVHELVSRLAARATILHGRCLPYGEGITFWPVAEMVKQAAGIETSDTASEARAKIERLLADHEVPEASSVGPSVSAALGLGGTEGAIQETYWAVRRLLEGLTARRPVVAVFDDIHWAEPALLDLFEYVAGFSRGHPLLLVCTARPELREARPDWGRLGTAVLLQPLDQSESHLLVENLLKRMPAAGEVRTRVVETAEGNPLFVEEMLRMLIDDGLLRAADGQWLTTGDLAAVRAPGTVQAVIAARLDRLEAQERAVIQRGSVVGRVFYWGAVAELTPADIRGRVGAQLQALARRELIAPEPSPFAGEDAFRFTHILVREAAYQSTPKRIRADLHERFAAWLERVSGERIAEFEEILAYHLEQAHRHLGELGPVDEHGLAVATSAAVHLAAAGQRAWARGDVRAAANLLSRAAGLLGDREPARAQLLATLGAVLTDTGDLVGAEAVLAESITAARALGDRRSEALGRLRSTWLRLFTLGFAENVEALPEVERATAVLEELGDDGGVAEGWTVVGMVHFWSGRAGLAIEEAERAVAHAERADDRRRASTALLLGALADCEGPTQLDEAARRLERLMHGAALRDRVLRTAIGSIYCEVEAMRGNFAVAAALAAEATLSARDLGLDVLDANRALRSAGHLAMLAGDPASAERELGEAVEILRRVGDLGHLSSVAPLLADAVYAQARFDEALALTDEAQAATMEGDVDAGVHWRRVKAKTCARLGRIDEARSLAREAVQLARPTDLLGLRGMSCADMSEVLELAGRSEEAIAVLREALEVFVSKGNIVLAEQARARLAELGFSSPHIGEPSA